MNKKALLGGVSATLLTAAVAGPALGQDASVDPPHPVHVHAGLCPNPGDVVVPLNDLVIGTDAIVGVGSATPVEVSITIVPLSLDDILGGEHAINAHQSADESDRYIACGDIGGQMLGDQGLAIGLAEQNGSGHQGVAWLSDNGDGTTRIEVFLMPTTPAMSPVGSPEPGQSMAPAGPDGSIAPAQTTVPVTTTVPSEVPVMTTVPSVVPTLVPLMTTVPVGSSPAPESPAPAS